jgi:glycosyltransferase involved in cell wall biosynthesis
MSCRIAVVTPSYQQGPFIERTILSVLTQDVDGVEYCIRDGGSRDETVPILRKYEDRLQWLSQKDKGQSDAVNQGLAATTAPVIGWLNSDDVYCPGAFSKVLACFDAEPEVDIIYGKAYHIDAEDRVMEEYPTEPWNMERLLDLCFICQPALFFRRRVVERIGPLEAGLRYTMDYEYWIRAAQAGLRFHYLEEFLAGSRLYAETKTLGSRVAVHKEMNDMLRRRVGRVPEKWIYNYAHAVTDARGVPREARFRYASHIAVQSWLASLRWYGTVPAEVRKLTWKWVWDNGRESLSRQMGRNRG